MPKEYDELMPKKVPLLLFAAIIGITLSILFLITLLQPELPWDLGDVLWTYTEGGIIPTLLNWVFLIFAIILVLLGLCAIMINRTAACLLLAISGFLFALLLWVAIAVMPFWYWW